MGNRTMGKKSGNYQSASGQFNTGKSESSNVASTPQRIVTTRHQSGMISVRVTTRTPASNNRTDK